MRSTYFLFIIQSLLVVCCLVTPATAEPAKKLPNIVVIFMDDMGYADIGCFGAKAYATPHIDSLATQGTRFTSFYVPQSVCSASRAALLTGCYPQRVGIDGVLGPHSKIGLPLEELTLAELCKQKGYATAIVGKWHLGDEKRFLPLNHGFDEYFGLPYSNDMTDLKPHVKAGAKRRHPPLPLISQESLVIREVTLKDQDSITTRYTEQAVSFINRNKDKPFFLYLPHTMTHTPLAVSDKFRGKSKAGLYADVMMEIDWSVGQVLAALKKNGITDNTLVVFSSDNGPWLCFGEHAGSAAPLRDGKFGSFDGGVRVPALMRWPKHIPAGRSCDTPLMSFDLLPTIAKIIDGKLSDRKIDGKDISHVIFDKSDESPHEVLYFYFWPNKLESLRAGKWKLELPRPYVTMTGQPVAKNGNRTRYRNAKINQPELYDLDTDPGQKHNLAAKHPEVVKRLLVLAEKARADLGDSLTKRKGTNLRPAGKLTGKHIWPASFPSFQKTPQPTP